MPRRSMFEFGIYMTSFSRWYMCVALTGNLVSPPPAWFNKHVSIGTSNPLYRSRLIKDHNGRLSFARSCWMG